MKRKLSKLVLCIVPCLILLSACSNTTTIYRENFKTGNNGVFGVYGNVIETKKGNILLEKAENAQYGPTTYFGSEEKNTDWQEGGMITEIKFKIDSQNTEAGQGFNWTTSLNGVNGEFINERSIYFRNVKGAFKVGYVFNGTSDALNEEATAKDSAVTLKDGWHSVKFHFYADAYKMMKVDISVENAKGKTVFIEKAAGFINADGQPLMEEEVGGIRYAWLSWMSTDVVEVSSIKVHVFE